MREDFHTAADLQVYLRTSGHWSGKRRVLMMFSMTGDTLALEEKRCPGVVAFKGN